MERKQSQFLLMLTALVVTGLTACRSNDGDSAPASASAAAQPLSDIAIASRLYAGTPRTPSGFLSDPAPASFEQVTTYHIKSQQIEPTVSTSYELCTDDWAQAFDWSEAVAMVAPVYLDLVSNSVTERYFEFDRVPRDEPTHYVRMRVYQCNYLNRSGVDLRVAEEFAGVFNQRPLNTPALSDLSEYLWHFTEYNNADHAVLESAPLAAASNLVHVLSLANLDRGGGTNGCDRVRIEQLQTTADEISGELARSVTPVRDFDVHRVGEAVLHCF